MAGRSAVLSVRIIADSKQARGELDSVESRLGRTQDKLRQFTGPATVAMGAMGGFATAAGKAASDAEQNIGAVETVFGSSADQILNWSKNSADAVGMSASSYDELAAKIGGSLKQAGYSSDEMAAKTNDLIGAGADLSSVFGGDAASAAEAMGAALRGEFDPLEQYGVFLNMNAVNAEMAKNGTDKLTGAAQDAAKKQTITNMILDQAAQYHGNFAKEADTAAGAQQRAQAAFGDAAAELGQALIPFMVQAAGAAKVFAQAIQAHPTLIRNIALAVTALAGGVLAANGVLTVFKAALAIQGAATAGITALSSFRAGLTSTTAAASTFTGKAGTIGGAIASVGRGMMTGVAAAAQWTAGMVRAGAVAVASAARMIAVKTAQLAIRAATMAWSAAQAILNAVLAANPITLIIVAVMALVAAFVTAYQRVGWFRDGVDKMVKVVVALWRKMAEIITAVWDMAVTAVVNRIRAIGDAFKAVGDTASRWLGNIRRWMDGIVEAARAVGRAVRDMFSNVSMPGWAKKLFHLSHGTPATGWAQNTTPDALPFLMTAAATPEWLPVPTTAGLGMSNVTQNTVINQNTFNIGALTDRLALARELKAILAEHDRIIGAA